jgi:outer membrane protein OmpA-like peptidoglycan-associated protein
MVFMGYSSPDMRLKHMEFATPRIMGRIFRYRPSFTATLAVALLVLAAGCTDYDVPGGDRPWPKLSEFPERPDEEKMEEQRRRLIGTYGDPADALPEPGEVPERPPAGALKVAVVQFDRAGVELDARTLDVLAQVAAYAQQARAYVWLFGYASRKIELASGGSARQAAQKLSSDRVLAVALALIEAGVPVERIQLVARGARDPVYLETAEAGRSGNRRVEIWFTR